MSGIDFDTGIEAARIAGLRVLDAEHRIVMVEWAAGQRAGFLDRLDLSPLIDTLRLFAPLRYDAELFATAHLIDDGHAIAWGDGAIDMSAESVERLAEEAGTDGRRMLLQRMRALPSRIGAMFRRDPARMRRRA